ncbi:MAG: hypothetical protein J1G38_01875 [Clostridiales bacterium]|nr:hypothetical protein [Clostridiales bacterium]
MKPIDIAIIVIVSVLFLAALGYAIYRKVKHKGCCDCGSDCGACNGCKGCGAHDGQNEKPDCCCCCGVNAPDQSEK